MKNLIRKWLGINNDIVAISADITTLVQQDQANAMHTYQLFHAMPFAAGALGLTAKTAASLTQPNGIQANSFGALLMGILIEARQGNSQLQLEGEVSEEIRNALTGRGFKVEEHEGSGGKSTFVLWT